MTTIMTVRALDVTREGGWDFGDSALHWRHRFGSRVTFDPFPCYPHQLSDVEKAAADVAERCPPLWNIHLYVANREEASRSNGHSNVDEGGHYEGTEWIKDPPTGLIVLSGKRIPPHPAMTRYLVAHEYGHNVEWMLMHARKYQGGLHSGELLRDYGIVRGFTKEHFHHGNGGNWHNSATEIFACDFRILVAKVERAHWPHPGITPPRDPSISSALRLWWADAMADLAVARSAEETP